MAANWTLTMPRRVGARDWLAPMAGQVAVWLERARERRALARLDDRMLRDIGIDHATARGEASKFFWER